MTDTAFTSFTTFAGQHCIATGSLQTNALAAKRALDAPASGPVLIFDDQTGRSIDVDIRGTEDEVVKRYAGAPSEATLDPQGLASEAVSPRGRGRPRLGVVPREVTLLPRHWDWLASQPGGASVALRKLVEEARRSGVEADQRRKAHERAYHFMAAIGGDLPGFEEATRALFADDAQRFDELLAVWPRDLRHHAVRLAFGLDSGQDLNA